MYPNREVFEASPLALVAAEIRFTDAARLRQQEVKDAVTIALEDRFPFAEPLQQYVRLLYSPPSDLMPRLTHLLAYDVHDSHQGELNAVAFAMHM